jgi:hypothetical protein
MLILIYGCRKKEMVGVSPTFPQHFIPKDFKHNKKLRKIVQ